jgi:hypothetical protein
MIYDRKLFIYEKRLDLLIALASELSPTDMIELSDGSEGIFVLLGKTGSAVEFEYKGFDLDDITDQVQGWYFEPLPTSKVQHPEFKDILLLVINK